MSKKSNQLVTGLATGCMLTMSATPTVAARQTPWKMVYPDAGITEVRVRANGAMTVLSVGDIGHIPPNLQSWGDDSDPQLLIPKEGSGT